MKRDEGKSFVSTSLTCFIKVPLPPVPEHAVRPGGRATLLAGVVILREQVVLVGGGEVQVSLDEPAEDLHRQRDAVVMMMVVADSSLIAS